MYNTKYRILLKMLCLVAIALCNIANVRAQHNNKDHRILVMLDASATMANHWEEGKSRYGVASGIITQLQKEMYLQNETIEFALWVYGHQYKASDKICKDVKREVAFSKDNLTQISLRLNDIAPLGNGSMNYAIDEVLKSDFVDTQHYQYSIVVITDSNKNCDNEFCMPANENRFSSLYKRFLVDLAGTRQSNCFDRVFSIRNNEDINAATTRITDSYPKQKKSVIKYETTNKPARTEKKNFVTETKAAKQTDDALIKPTIDTGSTRKIVEPISVRRNSRIKASTDEYGYVNLINVRDIGVIVLFSEEKGELKRIDDIFPIGLNSHKVQLKTGSYKAVYFIGSYEVGKSFNITTDAVTDVWMR